MHGTHEDFHKLLFHFVAVARVDVVSVVVILLVEANVDVEGSSLVIRLVVVSEIVVRDDVVVVLEESAVMHLQTPFK